MVCNTTKCYHTKCPVGVYIYKPPKEVNLIMKRIIAYFFCEVALFRSVNGLKVFPQGINSESLWIKIIFGGHEKIGLMPKKD